MFGGPVRMFPQAPLWLSTDGPDLVIIIIEENKLLKHA